MYRNSALLSIGAALVFSLFFFGVGHASQIQKRQGVPTLTAAAMNGTVNPSTTQVSITPTPCGGRSGAICREHSPLGLGEMATDGSRYISESMLVSLPAAGALFGAGLIALVGLGASRLRHHHGHHA